MVNTRKLKERAMKGLYVGVGAFGAGFVENLVEDNLGTGNLATSAVQLGIGVGASVGVDMVFDNPRSLPNEAVEFAGYGVQGAAWSNMAEVVQTGELAGNRSTVNMTTDGGSQTGQRAEVVELDTGTSRSSSGADNAFQAEVA
jgi:hypothetical protein